jgi:hypothetical protein
MGTLNFWQWKLLILQYYTFGWQNDKAELGEVQRLVEINTSQPIGHCMYRQFNIHQFCPHSEFMCFVWIWEQTAIISLYNINWLVFITET